MAWIEETGKTIYDETNVALEGAIKKFGNSSAAFIPSKRLRCAANSEFYFADFKNFTIDFWLGIDKNTAGGIISIGAGSNSALSLQLDGSGGLTWLSGNTPTSIGTFEINDFTSFDSILKGYYGGFTDGTYAYFVPYYNGSIFHGKAVRVPLNNFIPSAITVCDFTSFDSTLKGYVGGFTDGTYAYFVPYNNGSIFHGKAVRVPLNNFIPSAITVCDFTLFDSTLKGYYGGFTDGTYAYFVPYYNGSIYHGKTVRVPLNNFIPSAITVCDFTSFDSTLKGYLEGFTDGTYAYFVPYYNGSIYHGKTVRVPLNNFIPSAITVCDFTSFDSTLKGYYGGFTDGTYAYFVPYYNGSYHGKAVRVPLNNFTPSAITVCDFTLFDSTLKGYYGGFTDGTYAYFVPYYNGSYHGKAVRVPLNNFIPSAITVCDFTSFDSTLKGYNGGFTDGTYAYFVPYNNGSYHGKAVRVPLNKWNNTKIICGSGYVQMAHIAWVRKYNIDYLYVNGVLQNTNNSLINYGNGDLYINDKPDGSYSGCYIYIDELAIRGYPVFNNEFTPPTSAYTYP